MIPTSVKEIESYSFNNCISLTEITITILITSMCESVFSRCLYLIKIEIPSSITRIVNCSFKGWSSLNDVVITLFVTYVVISFPYSLIQIGTKSFASTSSRTEI